MIHDGTVSVEGGTGFYLVILGQHGAVLIGTWWYWVSMGRYLLVISGTGSVWGGTGSVWGTTVWYLVVLRQLALLVAT